MNEVSLFNEKTMTVKEIAQAMGVSYSSVYRAIEKHFPEKMENGKQTFLNESEVAIISKELKGDYHTSQMTFSAGEKVKNAVTAMELQQNFYQAAQAYAKYLEAEKARLEAENEAQKEKIALDAPKVETYNRIANSTGLKTMQEAAKLLGIGSNTLFSVLRDKGVFYRSNGVNLPAEKYIKRGLFEVKEEPYKRDNKDFVYTRVFATAKGLLWLEKQIAA